MLSLTPTNAEVQLWNCPDERSIFVALDQVRLCYDEMSDELWLGHSARTKKSRKKELDSNKEHEYTGPVTRTRARKS